MDRIDAKNRSMTSWYTIPVSLPMLASKEIGASAMSIRGGKIGNALSFGSYYASQLCNQDKSRNRLTTERMAWFR